MSAEASAKETAETSANTTAVDLEDTLNLEDALNLRAFGNFAALTGVAAGVNLLWNQRARKRAAPKFQVHAEALSAGMIARDTPGLTLRGRF